MITCSKQASDSYISKIESLQTILGNVPSDIICYSDMHWLINVALNDLKKQVKNEWNK